MRFIYESFDAFKKSPPPTPTGCAHCHVSNFLAAAPTQPKGWLPLTVGMIERIRRFHAYVEVPSLTMSVRLPDRSDKQRPVPRFTTCGLERFLSNPLPRHGAARQSMFPLEPSRLRTLLKRLAPELERCNDDGSPEPSLVEHGRELFGQLACATCHTGAGLGPRLRLGFPLLGRAYFRARVRHGAGNRMAPQVWQRSWEAVGGSLVATLAGAVAMPAHPDLSDSELDALYAYVEADRSDVPSPTRAVPDAKQIEVPDAIRLSLYRDVQKRVFDTTCRHCHSPDARDQLLIESVFGKAPGSAPVELPITRLAVSPNATLRKLLTPGAGCSDSLLLVRLKARAAEWAGHGITGAPRGMPMTLPPLDNDALRLVEVWSAAGCPSDHGDLCDACAAPRASAYRPRTGARTETAFEPTGTCSTRTPQWQQRTPLRDISKYLIIRREEGPFQACS